MGDCLSSPPNENPDSADSSQRLLSTDQEEEQREITERSREPIIKVCEDAEKLLEDAQREALNQAIITSDKGKELEAQIKEAYEWKEHYQQPTLEFSLKVSQLFRSSEEHFTFLSAQSTAECQSEADAIVRELLDLRTHLGPILLPLSMKNAFFREKVTLKSDNDKNREFRLDCIQFFEPILFYGNVRGRAHELVKLYVFQLVEASKGPPFMTFYVERTCPMGEFYHCLCFFCEGNIRGQFHIYGQRCPSYWEVRQLVLENAKQTIEHVISGGSKPLPDTICVTVLPAPRNPGPINL